MSGRVAAVLRFAASLAGAVLLACLVAQYERLAFAGAYPLARRCCDGAFVSAAVYLSAGLLSFVAHWGGFDALQYAGSRFADLFRPAGHKKAPSTYFDYVRAKSGGRRPPLRPLAVGALMLLAAAGIALVFLTDGRI